jgi:hypothetical protein
MLMHERVCQVRAQVSLLRGFPMGKSFVICSKEKNRPVTVAAVFGKEVFQTLQGSYIDGSSVVERPNRTVYHKHCISATFFQRDNKALLTNMRNITAAPGIRREEDRRV